MRTYRGTHKEGVFKIGLCLSVCLNPINISATHIIPVGKDSGSGRSGKMSISVIFENVSIQQKIPRKYYCYYSESQIYEYIDRHKFLDNSTKKHVSLKVDG